MKTKLIDSSEFHTSVGIYKRETRLIEINPDHAKATEHFYLNGEEYSSAKEIQETIGEEKYSILKAEVEKYSNWLEMYMFGVNNKS